MKIAFLTIAIVLYLVALVWLIILCVEYWEATLTLKLIVTAYWPVWLCSVIAKILTNAAKNE